MIAEKVFEKCISGIESCSKDKSLDDYLDSLHDDRKIRSKVSSVLFTYYRKKMSIQFIINEFTRKKPKTIILNILSVAVIQILYQDSIQNEVAVYIAVNYTKKRLGKGTSGFINAVLRKIILNLQNIETILNKAPSSIRNNIPASILDRWKQFYSDGDIECLVEIIKTPEEYIYFRKIEDRDSVLTTNYELVKLDKFESKFDFYRTKDFLQIIKSDALKKGDIYIQDPATSMAVSSINYTGEGKILDGCSAPGGKTLMLAELFSNCNIVATDRSPKRLERVRSNIKKAGFNNVKTILSDIRHTIFQKEEFDIVFLDVPCSNSGVLRKRPDVIWKLSNSYIDSLIILQRQILDSTKNLVKSGGKFIYSTCSIEYDENEGLIKKFLDMNRNFKLDLKKQLFPSPINDGAFVAVMTKK